MLEFHSYNLTEILNNELFFNSFFKDPSRKTDLINFIGSNAIKIVGVGWYGRILSVLMEKDVFLSPTSQFHVFFLGALW